MSDLIWTRLHWTVSKRATLPKSSQHPTVQYAENIPKCTETLRVKLLHGHTEQQIYQLINKSDLPQVCGCGVSTDGTPEGTLKAKEWGAGEIYLESLLLSMFLSPVVKNKQMVFSKNPTISACSRDLKTVGNHRLLIWKKTLCFVIRRHGR